MQFNCYIAFWSITQPLNLFPVRTIQRIMTRTTFGNFISKKSNDKVSWKCKKRMWCVLQFATINLIIKYKTHVKKNLYGPFFDGWSSTAWRLQSHYKKEVYFLPLSSQKFLALFWKTLEGWMAESTLESPVGFEHGTCSGKIDDR